MEAIVEIVCDAVFYSVVVYCVCGVVNTFMVTRAQRKMMDNKNGWDEMQGANVEFIVRACNSHDALLAACKDLADDHEFGATGTMRQDHLKAARDAIALAEKGGA